MMSNLKKVSVIIPNYNYGLYLAETIESVLQQTYENIEVIFIDDGSVDNSIEIASNYPITVLKQPNQGVSTARNNGASVATGDYLLFLDSDDLLYEDSLAVMVESLSAADEKIGYCYGQLQYFGEKNDVFLSAPFNAKKLAKQNYIQTSVLIYRELFDRVGGFDRGFDLREDWELFVRLWHNGFSGLYLPRPFIKYRKHRPKQVVRAMSKLRKRLSDVRLIRLYPFFFWRKLLLSPLRFIYYNLRYCNLSMVRQYESTGIFEILKKDKI